jgi:hypothetical protein
MRPTRQRSTCQAQAHQPCEYKHDSKPTEQQHKWNQQRAPALLALMSGELVGMQTTAEQPSSRAASATPCQESGAS